MTASDLTCLEPLVGKWQTRAHTEATVFGPGVPVTSTEEFYWLDGGYFLVQTYETVFGDEPAQRGINYWFHDAEVDKFRIIFFSNNGPFTEEGNRYEGEIANNALTFVGPARFQYDLDASGKIRKNEDGAVTIRWWLRDDHGQFQPWMTNVFSQVKVNDRRQAASDTARIRTLIENWAMAVSSGDRQAILAHHSPDVLMFDFPPHIVSGLEEYDKTWDFFYGSPKGPISFVASDLKVTAGADVGFASCLIHCDGTSAGPLDLRLTVGLRKLQGDWMVTHEHHSVPTIEERFLPPGAQPPRARGKHV